MHQEPTTRLPARRAKSADFRGLLMGRSTQKKHNGFAWFNKQDLTGKLELGEDLLKFWSVTRDLRYAQVAAWR